MAALTVFLAFFLFFAGLIFANRITSRPVKMLLTLVAVLASAPAGLYILYYAHLFDDATWYYNLRIRPNTELLAGGLGLLAGIIFAESKLESLRQRLAIPIVTLIALLIPFAKSLLDRVDYQKLKTDCPGDVCLQSTPSTCGPSSAATILKMYGDTASERELAEAASTSQGGTEVWYLARALQRRGYATQVIIQSPENPFPSPPAIAGVILPGGAGHFIAVLAKNNGKFTLADPLRGKSQIPDSELSKAYHFTGFFLTVHRK
jgi:Peptidase C39 family